MAEDELDLNTFLSDEEVEQILMQLALGSGGINSFNIDEAKLAIDWAIKVRLEEAFLGLVLKGLITINIHEGKPEFKLSDVARDVLLHKDDQLKPDDADKMIKGVEDFLKNNKEPQ